jgi:hypothetical protein
MDDGLAIVGHLQQVEPKAPEHARFFFREFNDVRNDALWGFLLILRPLPHF